MKETKHCSSCGGLIDNDMKCTKCGHQYFNKEKDTYKVISFVLALLCCILLFWALENYNLYFRETVYSAELENDNKLLNENIPFNKEDKIYVHCQSGVRSSIAVGILENKGFENVVNIREGYQDFPESLK